MIRATTFRLLALAGSMAAVLSCDAGAPTGLGEFLGGNGADTIGGGTGGNPSVGGDGRLPVATIDTPTVYGSLVNVGDSILVAVRARDVGTGIKSIEIAGLTVKGNAEVGTQVITPRYVTVLSPPTGSTFAPGTATRADTVIRRILFPAIPVDSTPDSLVIRAIVTDHSGLADTATQVVRLVAGPRVVITSPIANDSVRPSTRVTVRFTASHPDGVAEVRLRAVGESTWPTPLDVTFPTFTFSGNPRDVVDSASFLIPADAPGRGRVTITAEAIDANRTPGNATPVVIRIRASEAAVPIVRQIVPPRAELADSITIMANGGNGIASIGFIVNDYDGGGAEIKRASMTLPGDASNVSVRMSMALPASVQGKRISITSFATDRSGRTGYSVSSTSTVPVDNVAEALKDTVLVVYGRTFALPRAGVAGDVTVNPANGHVFVSNTKFNRLEVWQASTSTFDPNGVAVGAEPWGMTIAANNPNELLVANSGGTNISRVDIAPSSVSSIGESGRILTRNTIAYTVTESRDERTGAIRFLLKGPFSYSDRPQYIAQSAGDRIYYSTRPTPAAPAGTLRYLDANAGPVPDSRQIYQYGAPTVSGNIISLFNVDLVVVIAEPVGSFLSDSLIICDHNTNTADARVCTGTRVGTAESVAELRSRVNTDVVAAQVDVESLALTDTTFVGWSGNRNWIAFGEGAKAGAGRVMMVNDPAGTPLNGIFFSEGVDIIDLVDNASEPVFGLALDVQGRALAVHGAQSYFGAVEYPFHLRMQGRFDSFDRGAGIAFHPQANVNPAVQTDRNDPTRLAFVASENGTIEIIDAYYFVSRGRVVVRNKLYGPLRASLPLTAAEAAAGVVVKLYSMTDQGLVVVDINASDVKPVP